MLFYSPQIWTSDNTDALCRIKIQYGTSLFYPPKCMGSHYSSIPNHITMSSCQSRTRAIVAMCGTFGFELDLAKISEKEAEAARAYIFVYKSVEHLIRKGQLYRLWSPFDGSLSSIMFVLPSKLEAVVFAFNQGTAHWSTLIPRLRLQGLDPAFMYTCTEPLPNYFTRLKSNVQVVEVNEPSYLLGSAKMALSGAALMHLGLPVKFFSEDDAHCILLTADSPRAGEKMPGSPPKGVFADADYDDGQEAPTF